MIQSNQIAHILDSAYKDNRRFYVYRLVDPRTLQTFYVGKGCGNRILQHVEDAKKLINDDEDATSLKLQQISEILSAGKQVISIIHRRGLTEKEAFEVEAALIDSYPGLTNIQSGHDSERGVITLEDLCEIFNTVEYSEPEEEYIIIKTTANAVANNGGLYEATRKAWRGSIKNAESYKFVLAVVNGIVREVYEVNRWYQYNQDRIAFEGVISNQQSMVALKGKLIPRIYRQKGNANPFLYKKV